VAIIIIDYRGENSVRNSSFSRRQAFIFPLGRAGGWSTGRVAVKTVEMCHLAAKDRLLSPHCVTVVKRCQSPAKPTSNMQHAICVACRRPAGNSILGGSYEHDSFAVSGGNIL